MKTCTICGMTVNKLDYGRLKIKSITNIKVLGENVKNKNTTLDLVLCDKCRDEIQTEIIFRGRDTKKETGCNGDCANCDGARI